MSSEFVSGQLYEFLKGYRTIDGAALNHNFETILNDIISAGIYQVYLGGFINDSSAVAFAASKDVMLSDGLMYFNETDNKLRIYDSGVWVNYDVASQAAAAAAMAAAAQAAQSLIAVQAAETAALSAIAAASVGSPYNSVSDALSNGVWGLTNLVVGNSGANGTFALIFSGGGGTGASGIFTVAGGAVVPGSIIITYKGINYTTVPTVSFANSAGLTGASATVQIGQNQSAGTYFYTIVTAGGFNYYQSTGSGATLIETFFTSGMLVPEQGRDKETDAISPLFINAYPFIRSSLTPVSFTQGTILSRDSDYQFTMTAGQGNKFIQDGSFVLKDDTTGRYLSFSCFSVVGDVVTIYPCDGPLPAVISTMQTMHRDGVGQHLSDMAIYGEADYFVNTASERFSSKKYAPLAAYNAALCSSISFNTYNIVSYDKSRLLFPVETIGGAVGGGVVPGTDLDRFCQNLEGDVNINTMFPAPYVSRSYQIRGNAAGAGIRLRFNTFGYEGFVNIACCAIARSYNTNPVTTPQKATGRCRVQVYADGVSISNMIYEQGKLQDLFIDYPKCQVLTVEFTLADNTVSEINLYGIWLWAKSGDTANISPFKNFMKIVLNGDSWRIYPPGNNGTLHADGTAVDGQAYFMARLQQRLNADGYLNTIVYNMARGQQTSQWGLAFEYTNYQYNFDLAEIHYSINDMNSAPNVPGHTPSAFDIDLNNQWTNVGGPIFGSVTPAQWFDNLIQMSKRFATRGTTPVIQFPPITASAGQSQLLQQNMTNRIAGGFNPFYATSGRP